MSALEIVIAKLKTIAPVTALTTPNRIYAISAPQGAVMPYLVVNLITEVDYGLTEGAGEFNESRVSIVCAAGSGTLANDLGEKVKVGLRNVVKETIAGHVGTDITKASDDVSDYSDDRTVFRRMHDWYVIWR